MMAGYIYDLAQLIHQLQRGARHHRRPLARRQHRAALRRALPRERRQAGRHRGARAHRRRCWPSASPKRFPERMRAWIDAQRGLSGRLPRRYASIEDAFKRMQEENKHLTPEQARHLTQHGVNQNEDGTYSWKFDNYVRSWPPYDMTARRRARRCGRASPARRCSSTARRAGPPTRPGRPRAALPATPRSSPSTAPDTGCTTTALDEFLALLRRFLGA